MRTSSWIALVAAMSIVAFAFESWSQESAPVGHRVETERLILEWEGTPDSAEVEVVKARAVETYDRVAELLGERPDSKVTVLLRGPAERTDGSRDYPRVDTAGRIHLFTSVPEVESYFGALAHEMVHAFRIDRRFTADWFFEEGFAELIALRADPSLAGFPWFDFPVAVVAGQWLTTDEDIPLSALRERHRQLNLPCKAQSYALRSAFFDWLGRAFGDEVVIKAAQPRPAGKLADYEKHFGKPFGELEQAWREALLTEYSAIPDAKTLAKQYRLESPIQYMRVCSAGGDF